ncbi:FtsX-like permease family protein [Jidongwangia harbinensis]|uniref:FtsX-like permease family protein n=1 Tax=Jidongwangia harbinensis TaxID=2878561 RepID=UPI001CD9616C|nr:FtsX-like permease family protein [Jidongwangia harbinensis]MCA2214210.1 ABC transporter permease [Jidongwangia harbinensis]
MIALVLAMVWHRRGQAVTLALLSLLAVTAAVAAPAYLRAADRAVASGQAATATAPERSFALSQSEPDRRGQAGAEARRTGLEQSRSALLELPGFEYVYATQFPAVGIEPDERFRTLVVHRQNACAHLVMVTGRCLVGEADVVIGEDTARRLGIAAGDSITLTWAFFNDDPAMRVWEAAGTGKRLLVAGVYRVPDPDADYWGANGYFSYGERVGEPAFVGAATFAATDRGAIQVSIDGIAGPGALAVDRLPAVRDRLAALQTQLTTLGTPVRLETGIPGLLDRIERGRDAAHLIVPVLSTALVLLACLTIFLAVGQSAEARRPEIAVVALRGARPGPRWWLATGESLVAIAAGAVAGCLTGQLLVNAIAAARFPGVGADPSLTSLRYAPLAALAAVLTAVLAQVRQLRGAAGALLLRAPATPSGVAAAAVPAAVAGLAVAAAVQLALSGGALAGIGTFAAGLLMIAAAQLVARAVLPVVTRYAGRALRTGRLGVALAAFPLSRRAGATRLFALLVAAVAVIGYAACAVDVGRQGRVLQAEVGTGADRVLTLQPVGRRQLLTAVRSADPQGRYAMAVIRLPSAGNQPAGLAVDSTRLAAVPAWPGGGPAPAAVAAALRPPAATSVTVGGAALSLDVTATGLAGNKPVGLGVVLSAPGGAGDVAVPLGDVRNGRHTYRRTVAVCRDGCFVKALRFTEGEGISLVTGRVTVHGLGDAGPDSRLGDPGRWRASTDGTVAAAPDGLAIDVTTLNGPPDHLLLQPADTPYPLPAATAGPVPQRAVEGLDRRVVPVDPVHRLAAVPGAGAPATLVDLEYLERLSVDVGQTADAEVWLSDEAPAGVLRALQQRGLEIVADTRATQVRERLDRQGPALALWYFLLAAALAAGLAAGALVLAATVDRRRLVEDLSALRAQGLSRRVVAGATLGTYPALVVAAVLAGMPIAAAVWGLTGWALPLAGLDPPPLPLPRWPRPEVLALVAAAVVAVLSAVAGVTARRTRGGIR